MADVGEFGHNPYRASGAPTLLPSYVVFLDVLGFRELIREAEKAGTLDELLKAVRAALDESHEVLHDLAAVTYQTKYASSFAKAFSDNIVIGFPIHGEFDDEGMFGTMMMEVAQLQLAFLRRGLFVRGAMAFGDYYADEEMSFGMPLLRAVEGEKSADSPRIVLLPEVVDKVRHFLKFSELETSAHSFFTLRDEDGRYFLNYLALVMDDRDNEDEAVDYWLKLHRETVMAAIEKFGDDPKLLKKYEWAARYHQSLCTLEGLPESLRAPSRFAGTSERISTEMPE